ncbi:hypothetical protein GPECTOR_8g185 [Gonium pectorale]|uniref:DNA replication ATP-dependent helicase/nuclease n=1 Tax=Gonium pectorale TaxID=33097 RepID=A0A150GSY1_GONPE|nr:hypothetical protein GPECTOR_8g185 [Gonium pectorale]|eukprot:KXZ52798.1 hypothetical protein GPECTOR_8g185 [Gonium pectorale]
MKGGNSSQEAPSASQPPDNSQASKDGFRKNLIQAVQRTASDADRQDDQPVEHAADGTGGDAPDLLQARRSSHRETSTSARDARLNDLPRARSGTRKSPLSQKVATSGAEQPPAGAAAAAAAGDDADQVMLEVLSSTEVYKTPAAAKPAGLARLAAGNRSAECMRPPSSGLTLGKRPHAASTKKAASGNKRRALLDLLDQTAVPNPKLLGDREEVHCVVLEVEEQHSGHFKVLRCFNEYKGSEVRVYLRDMWADQAVRPGDTVNVVGGRVLADQVCEGVELSASEGLLILHPDVLLSGTNITTALRCSRQAWLQERVAGGPSGEKALLGSMMHELLQASLRAALGGRLDKNEMLAQARSILSSSTAQLLETQQDEASVMSYLSQQLDAVLAWCRTYVTPGHDAPLGGRIETAGNGDAPTFCRVAEILDIEESIWAPKYGLKGMLDASLRVTLSVKDPLHNQRTLFGGFASTQQQQQHQGGQQQQPARFHGHQQQTVIAPFEFKTGKDWHEHKAQVLLYLLLMEDRYQEAIRTGLLWNINKPSMQAVRYAHHELASLIMHRNRLAAYLVAGAAEPPPPLLGSESERKCEYCSLAPTCALYLAAAAHGAGAGAAGAEGQVADGGKSGASQLAEMDLHHGLRERLAGIAPSTAAFFAHWLRLVDLEEEAARSNRADMWAIAGPQRELMGGCVAQLLFQRELPPQEGPDGRRYLYVFSRQPSTPTPQAAPPSSSGAGLDSADGNAADEAALDGGLLSSGFTVGDMGVLGVEGRHAAAARVTVADVSRAGSGGQGGKGGKGGGGGSGGSGGGSQSASQLQRERNLAQLRKLVIELQAPQQGVVGGGLGSGSQLSGQLPSSQLQVSHYLRDHAHLMNGEQLEAVSRVLAMQDYAILLGMPGTGKTTTIVHVIRALVEARVSILVASYTNSAVDNILLKLVGTGVSFVRLGSAQSVHPGVRAHMPGGAHFPDTSVAGLQEMMAHVNVVGCTCLSVHNPLLSGRTFGVCILDEASQVTLPASIGALALARSFLLVGDHYQLSPLVVSREAAQGGLGVSLFRRLSEAHPQAVVTLRSQYRMAADIMALSNALVYNGRMLCGNELVANATLHLPRLHMLSAVGGSAASACAPWPAGLPVPSWLLAALQPQCRVLLLDTDRVAGCREQVLQDGMVNPGEVRVVHGLVAALVAAGLPPRDIGVASPYKAQVAALQPALSTLLSPAVAEAAVAGGGGDGGGAVEVLTVDKYQGRDKPAILLSFVRCNASRSAGRLLADWQRLNVAITRARTKLLLVGSAATLGSIPLLADMLALLRRNGWVAQLPVDCLVALPAVRAAAAPA